MNISTEIYGNYRYHVIRSGSNSDKLGDCEVCGKYVSDVCHQIEERQYEGGWTRHECHSLFGHEQCLIEQRKSQVEKFAALA